MIIFESHNWKLNIFPNENILLTHMSVQVIELDRYGTKINLHTRHFVLCKAEKKEFSFKSQYNITRVTTSLNTGYQ